MSMSHEVKSISPGGVNCYLLKADAGFVLIDTGFSSKRSDLERWLEAEGCKPGLLRLIVLTHGDVDHAGNAAYLRGKFGAKIAMHRDDTVVVRTGNMGACRKARPDHVSPIFRVMMLFGPLLFPPRKFETFEPDVLVEDGQDLSQFGLDARVLSIPGHSKGSVGVVTADGEAFCGDLLADFGKPGFHMMIDDMDAARSSLDKLKKGGARIVYPGHGKPFPMERLAG